MHRSCSSLFEFVEHFAKGVLSAKRLIVCSLLVGHWQLWAGTPSFQHAVAKLKKKANVEQACDGYYHLTGRAELALTVQRRILPTFGFAASRAGVLDMVLHCTRFLSDDEIAHLWDDINMKLGMTPDACRRFRESAAGFKSHRSSEIGQVAMEENSRV